MVGEPILYVTFALGSKLPKYISSYDVKSIAPVAPLTDVTPPTTLIAPVFALYVADPETDIADLTLEFV